MQLLATGTPTEENLNTAFDLTLDGENEYYSYSKNELVYICIGIGMIAGGGDVVVTAKVRIGSSGDTTKYILDTATWTIYDGDNPVRHIIGPYFCPYGAGVMDYLRVNISTNGGDDAIMAFGYVIRESDAVGENASGEPVFTIAKVSAGASGSSANLSLTNGDMDVNVSQYAGATATVNGSDSKPEVHAVDVDAIGGNTPGSFDDVIPDSPTAGSINERIKSMDELIESGGAGDLATMAADTATAILAAKGITAGDTWTVGKLFKVIAAILAGKIQTKTGESPVREILDPDDGITVIGEITISTTTPYQQLTVH